MLISRWRSSDEAHRLRLPLPRLIIRRELLAIDNRDQAIEVGSL